MGGYIGAKTGTLVASASDIRGDISATDTTPEIVLKNTTETDADGGREGTVTFKGEKSGGEEVTLAQIEGSHDDTNDDSRGQLVFKTNNNQLGDNVTEAKMTINSVGDVDVTSGAPSITITNTTHEDTDGGREGKLKFKGEQSGGELSTLAEIEASHDGTADDEKGDLIFKTNDGSDGASPTEAMRIQSDQKIGVGLSSNISSQLHVNSEVSLGPDNNNRMIIGSTAAGVGSIGTIEAGTASFSTATFKGGNVGIGTSSPTVSNGKGLVIADATAARLKLCDTTTGEGASDGVQLGHSGGIGFLFNHENEAFQFGTNNAERMRIDSDGVLVHGKTAKSELTKGTTIELNSGGGRIVVTGDGSTGGALFLGNSTSGNVGLMRENGDFECINNSYTGFSDERLKENIEDSGSQWDDIKALRVRKFSFIRDEVDAPDKIGVIAQELEASGMSGLVSTNPDLSNPEETTKSVKYSILYMKAVKALQEAMTRIEALEAQNTTQATQIADLITRVTALEAE